MDHAVWMFLDEITTMILLIVQALIDLFFWQIGRACCNFSNFFISAHSSDFLPMTWVLVLPIWHVGLVNTPKGTRILSWSTSWCLPQSQCLTVTHCSIILLRQPHFSSANSELLNVYYYILPSIGFHLFVKHSINSIPYHPSSVATLLFSRHRAVVIPNHYSIVRNKRRPYVYWFWIFSRPYSLIKGPTFIKFWNFCHGIQIFPSLMGFL